MAGHTIVLYHRTTPDAAATIYATGRMVSRENPPYAYFSAKRYGQVEGYGEGLVVIAINPVHAELDDEFPGGEQHYRVLAPLINYGCLACPHCGSQAGYREAVGGRCLTCHGTIVERVGSEV